MDIEQILMIAVPLLGGLGFIWSRAEKALKALKEVSDVLIALSVALEDKDLSKDEIANIKLQGKEALAALKAIVGK